MKCKKCGCELKEKDIFCQECGTRYEESEKDITPNETAKIDKQVVSQSKQWSSMKTKIGIIIVAVIVLSISGVLYFVSKPDNVKLEAYELEEVMYGEDVNEYLKDNLFVHGYLMIDINDENSFWLYSKDKPEKMVIVECDEKLAKDLGNESEITVIGNLKEYSNSGFLILSANDIEIHEKKEKIINLGIIDDVVDNANKYLNQKINFVGKLMENWSGAYVTDELLEKSIWLNDISNQELAEYQDKGSWISVTGILIKDNGNLAIKVDKIEQNEVTEMIEDVEISKQEYTVDEIMASPKRFLNKQISIVGKLPMNTVEDIHGVQSQVVFNETSEIFIVCKGMHFSIGNCKVLLNGVLTTDGDQLILEVEEYTLLEQYSAGVY